MKKNILFMVITFLFAGITSAQTTISNAKAVELTAHRIDRLVALNKIDGSFLKKMEKIEVTVVQNQAPVFYKTKVSQTKPVQGNPMQVEISLDKDGKPLAFQLIPNGVAGPDVAWSGKVAGELIESTLHYVLEHNNEGKVSLFDTSATSVTLTKIIMNGQSVARGQVTSSTTTEKLNVYVQLDGTFISAEVAP